MPDETIDFTISIPIRMIDANNISQAFISKFGYQATLYDPQGNAYANPVTPEMFVEDMVANHILKVTADYLVDQSIRSAINQAVSISQSQIEEIGEWFKSQSGNS